LIDRPVSEVVAAGGRFLWLGRRPKSGSWTFLGLRAREEVMQALFKRLWRDDSGEDTTEYVLLVLLAALAVIAGMSFFATEINGAFGKTGRMLINWI